MNKFFRLYPFCVYEETLYNACIYNLSNGDVIKVSEDYRNFLHNCEIEIKPVDDKYKYIAIDLQNKGLGKIYDNKIYSCYLHEGLELEEELEFKTNNTLMTLFLEITTKCNLDCEFCHYPNSFMRRTGCSRDKSETVMTPEIGKKAIQEAAKLGAKQIVFIGGEPSLYINNLKEFVDFGEKCGINNFILYTNGYHVNDKILNYIQNKNFMVNLQIVSLNPKDATVITGRTDYVEAIKHTLSNLDITNLYITVLIGEKNKDAFNNIHDYISTKYPSAFINKEFIYPGTDFDYSLDDKTALKIPRLKKVNVVGYSENLKHHNCFSKSISVSANGNILPCIMLKNNILGNITDSKLSTILYQDAYFKYKYLSKSRIKPCNLCAYRFSCSDCRAINKSLYNEAYCNIADFISSRERKNSL